MQTPGAAGLLAGRTKSGFARDLLLTVAAVGVLGLAVFDFAASHNIRAAEAAPGEATKSDTADEQVAPDQNTGIEPDLTKTVEGDIPSWGTAFGTPPPPQPVSRPEPEPVVSQPVAPEPADIETQPARDRSQDYRLTGHILAGAGSVAIVHDGSEEQVVRVGATLSGGEVVTDISSEGVIAQYAGQDFLIVLPEVTSSLRRANTQAGATDQELDDASWDDEGWDDENWDDEGWDDENWDDEGWDDENWDDEGWDDENWDDDDFE